MHRTVKYVLLSMRPEQWIKNAFIFLALIFSRNLFHPDLLLNVSVGFILFCLASSSVYIFNDIRDRDYDRAHPEKSKRPIAAGLLRVEGAGIIAFLLASVSLAAAYLINSLLFFVLATYLIINLFYTVRLKNVVILDVMCIASGFVLRVFAGTVLAGVAATDWLYICTITISLFLGFSKRRQELVTLGENANNQREILSEYSVPFLDQMINVATACTVMSYALYTISPETVARFGTSNLISTIPFVLYGIFRYLYLLHTKDLGGNPASAILKDIPLILNSLLWLAAVVLIIY
jgi:4-hydroxybenzoate polyprenyltransferase